MFCYYCHQEIKYDRWCDFLRYHVHKLHNVDINLKEYYDKFLKKENEGFCKTCGKPTNFQDMNNGYSKFCSQKCVNADPEIAKIQKEKRKQYFENLSEEETKNRSNKLKEKWKERDVNSMVDKIKSTKLEKYGDERYNNSNQIKVSANNRTIEENILVSNNIREAISQRSEEYKNEIANKRKQTLFDRYGDENYSNLEQRVKTYLSKYGVKYYRDEEKRLKHWLENKPNHKIRVYTEEYKIFVGEKIRQSILQRSEDYKNEILSKRKQTLLKRYGDENYTNKEKMVKSYYANKLKRVNESLKDRDVIITSLEAYEYHGKCKICHTKFSMTNQRFYLRNKRNEIICPKCNPFDNCSSSGEKLLLQFIENNYNGEILSNRRNILGSYELDIYIPKLKLAFEFNGLYWHGELNKPDHYHKMKTELCEEKGIHLIHIYEDDWELNREIVKSRILNLLGKSEKIFARKCIIKELNFNITKEFLINNHIQGFCISKINLGLYYNDELISVMTLGNKRLNLGNKEIKDGEYELLRFCNKINTTTIGGANKLFKYFLDKYKPKEIISYADRSWTMNNGNTLYDKLGFKLDKITEENYYYVVDKIRENRFKYRKDELVRQGFDKNKTEREIMLDNGYFRIYDSGQLKFKYIV